MRSVRIALCQYNFTLGDIKSNMFKIREGITRALDEGSDIAVFPELAMTGYPPEDLVFKPKFIDDSINAIENLTEFSKKKDILIIAGYVYRDNSSGNIFDSAGIIYSGRLADVYHKIYLPNYGVFDEQRYFSPGSSLPVYTFRGVRIGVNICEDIWYPTGPLHYQSSALNAELIVNISASPFHAGKQDYRENMFSTRAGDESVYLVNCNLVGGQDELVFDGFSTSYDEDGNLTSRLEGFKEDFTVIGMDADSVFRKRLKDIRRKQEKESLVSPFKLSSIEIGDNRADMGSLAVKAPIKEKKDIIADIYEALKLGTRDYVNKNGFEKVIIAVSGGIDSALVAAIAADALGPERVKGIFLPSVFSASISGEDARKLSENLGIELLELSIQDIFEMFNVKLSGIFGGKPPGIAEENLQSRIRGNMVMALSNKFGWLVLTTGNKSEMSAGYATLYGDMAGGFAVIKDVLKTTVYRLAEYRNGLGHVIPARIIERPPSAELRADQKDTDSLPDYDILDSIIKAYVEQDKPLEEIIAGTADGALVRKVAAMIDKSEYKRRQSPPGIKITPRAFGRDRRMPITSKFSNF
ncbi:MAG: NAD+ synthase [Brevinematales bacterium]|jgi:NAD+ synthase (glutamine-hydrolysing)